MYSGVTCRYILSSSQKQSVKLRERRAKVVCKLWADAKGTTNPKAATTTTKPTDKQQQQQQRDKGEDGK